MENQITSNKQRSPNKKVPTLTSNSNKKLLTLRGHPMIHLHKNEEDQIESREIYDP